MNLIVFTVLTLLSCFLCLYLNIYSERYQYLWCKEKCPEECSKCFNEICKLQQIKTTGKLGGNDKEQNNG